jgi:hypothetical protein
MLFIFLQIALLSGVFHNHAYADETLPDTEAPTNPANLTCLSFSDRIVNLAWDASADNVNVAGYKIYRDDMEIGETDTVSYTNTNLTQGNAHSYFIIRRPRTKSLTEFPKARQIIHMTG